MSASENVLQSRARILREEALRLGFRHCGISKAAQLDEEAPRLEQWLAGNRHGRMSYMENHFDKRLDPRKLVDGARTVVSFLYNYYPEQALEQEGVPKISRYAYGQDYHDVIRDKLKELVEALRERIGEINGRIFVDSAPVLERAWARRSGLGWIGKNSQLTHKGEGSYFFLAELITDLELEPDLPMQEYCGTCNRCVEACPTEAIIQPKTVDGSKCISYFTIELKGEIPAAEKGKFGDWIFGCDICQEVCPWNRFASVHEEQKFKPSDALLSLHRNGWTELTEDVFKKVFSGTAVMRTGYKGLVRNLEFVRKLS